ncbi:hypothetical protein D3C76_1565760 [compost metagenome]
MRAFNRRGRVADNVLAGGDRSGQRYHTYFFVSGQWVANGFSASEEDVKDASREDIFCQLAQL